MKCKFCSSNIHEAIFNLGNFPAANSLISKESLFKRESTFPLVLYVCPQCLLVQIEEQHSGNEIFDENYVYYSSTSSHWVSHAKEYSDKITDRLNLDQNSFVVEVASNDGYLLKNFVEKNIKCLGIEPAKSVAAVAKKIGVPTLVEFFNLDLAKNLEESGNQADLIIANNVLAHVPSINDFVSSFKRLLKPDGTITVEFPHLLSMVKNKEFDTIYHEHFFYFSLFVVKRIFSEHGLSIYDVEKIDTHGGSLRIYATHQNNSIDERSSKESVTKLIEIELNKGLNSIEFYSTIKEDALDVKLIALEFLVKQKMRGRKIAAFGAAAKGNTFLNYAGIKNDIIDFVVDETPSKIGKFMPQSKIPICAMNKITEEKPDVIVILPWNHKKEIVRKLSFTKRWGCKLVVFIPEIEVF